MKTRLLKFKRYHFNADDHLISVTEWGQLEKGCFSSPSRVSGCFRYVDAQYTGVFGMNAEEIYEHDVLEQSGMKLTVVFRYGSFMFASSQDNGAVFNPYATDFHHTFNQYSKKGIDTEKKGLCYMRKIGNKFGEPIKK